MYFVGILGSGMSAIAQYCAWAKIRVCGSDRLQGSSDVNELGDKLAALGCTLFPQDGSGITTAVDAVVVSTAIEDTNPDIAAAKKLGIPVYHRSDVLAAIVETKRCIAVAGTSGKSTVTAMIWEFLFACGKNPSLISGAPLLCLEEKGLVGNAYWGESDLLVIEADESDGTLVKYHPATSVILNISKDHKPVPETLQLFKTLASQSQTVVVNADDKQLTVIPSVQSFGIAKNAAVFPSAVHFLSPYVSFSRNGRVFDLPLPGKHNLSNCLAAIAICELEDCRSDALADAVRAFKGVYRRFSVTELPNGITVIDDYAHNPEKIRAAIEAAQGFSKRLIAVFQPHGFGPTRFLKDDLVAVFSETLRKDDILFLLPIYYAGGTAQKDISSDDIVSLVKANGKAAFVASDRPDLMHRIKSLILPQNTVLVMGARDPSLGSLAKELCQTLSAS